MISNGMVEDYPRLEIAAVSALLPTDSTHAVVEIDLDVDGHRSARAVMLEATPLPRRGGLRWWWRCPRCGTRRAHLYLREDVACRECLGVRHASQYRR